MHLPAIGRRTMVSSMSRFAREARDIPEHMHRETASTSYRDRAHQLRRLATQLHDSECGYALNALACWYNARSSDEEPERDRNWRARLDSNQRPRA
jgi:hypothetical protein